MELIARGEDLRELTERLRDGRRLITVSGPGGIGKTTLARRALRVLAPDDVSARFVDLTRIERDDAVTTAIAAQLGFASFEVMLSSSGELGPVVLIDNCEHVAHGAAEAVTALLEASDQLTILTTSRSPLAVPGESIIDLAPLPLPGRDEPAARTGAVALFCERARDSGVEIQDDQLEEVADLCRRVDGMPLAIELAAARLRVLALRDVVARVHAGIDVLQRAHFRGAARHRSVRETVNWSIELLDPRDRAAFVALSVCAGPFPADVAAAVTAIGSDAVEPVLERLTEASLLSLDRDASVTRFRMLEPIRAAAHQQLTAAGGLDRARERLTAYVCDAMIAMFQEAGDVWTADLLPTLLARFDQVDVALRYCLEHDDEPTRSRILYAALWGVVHQARVDEVLRLGDLLRERWPDLSGPFGADAAATYAIGQLLCGEIDRAVALATEALGHAHGSVMASAGLLRILGLAARYRQDHQQAERLLGEAAAAALACDFPTVDLECRVYRAQDLAVLGRGAEALIIVRAVADEARRRGSVINEIWARTVEAAVLAGGPTAADDHGAAALAVAEATLVHSRAISYPFGIICNLQTLAACQLRRGDVTAASERAEQLLDAVARSGAGDFRRGLDVATAVLLAVGHPLAGDLHDSARGLPDTNPMILDLTLPSVRETEGRGLSRPAATAAAIAALRAVRAAPTPDGDGGGGGGAADRGAGDAPSILRQGDLWEIRFGGQLLHVPTSKGIEDLAALLAQPGREIHCLELAGAGVEEAGLGEAIDGRARRQYEDRIRALQDEIDEAEDRHDVGTAERARAEMDALVDHLTAALGLRGKARRLGGTTERARSAVTHRIRNAVRRLGSMHPALGRHLEASVSTGTYCRYQPEVPTTWRT